MNRILNLKKRIMARIYFEYTKDMVFKYPDYFMLAIFIIVSFLSVSIHHVFINTTGILRSNSFSIFNFFIAALRDTSWIIQALIAGFFLRTFIAGIILTYKNMNTKWIMTKFRYQE